MHATPVIRKTISIDLEAYELLAAHKKEGQSFSQVIKAIVPGKPPKTGTGADLLEVLRHTQISEETLDRIEEVVRDRAKSPVRVPRW